MPPSMSFSPQALLKMLQGLGALATSPEGRRIIAERLETAVRRHRLGGVTLDKVKIMYAYFRDAAEPLGPKLMIGAALLYLIIPNDLLPDWVPLLGLTDDFTAIAIVWQRLHDVLTHYEERRLARITPEEAL